MIRGASVGSRKTDACIDHPMLASPRHSRVILINPSRGGPGNVSAEGAARRIESLSLLAAAHEMFNVPVHAVGEYQPAGLPAESDGFVTVLDLDGLAPWNSQQFANSLAASGGGVIFLAGAWLEEDVLIAGLEGARLGYDVRLLADLSIARLEADRPLVLNRLALHGVLTMTVRQAMLEWAVCHEDPALKIRVQQLLS
jgi:hypothetical protein